MEIDYTRKAYAILTGRWPLPSVNNQDCMARVVREWDGRKFDNQYLERIARMALCEIMLSWSEVKSSPDADILVAERLREMCPALGDEVITIEQVQVLYRHNEANPV